MIAYIHSSTFYYAIEIKRPFAASLFVEGCVWCAELAVLAPIVANTGCFNLYGIAAFFICLGVTFVAILISRVFIGKLNINVEKITPLPDSGDKNVSHHSFPDFKTAFTNFLKIELCLLLCQALLVGYIFAFRYVTDSIQVNFLTLQHLHISPNHCYNRTSSLQYFVCQYLSSE